MLAAPQEKQKQKQKQRFHHNMGNLIFSQHNTDEHTRRHGLCLFLILRMKSLIFNIAHVFASFETRIPKKKLKTQFARSSMFCLDANANASSSSELSLVFCFRSARAKHLRSFSLSLSSSVFLSLFPSVYNKGNDPVNPSFSTVSF